MRREGRKAQMRSKGGRGEREGDRVRSAEGKEKGDFRLVEVYRAANDEEALVIKGLLESQGIHCLLRSRVVHAVHPFSMDGLGEVKIMVAEGDELEARALISSAWKQIPPRPPARGVR
jgi:hypothetical protein